MDTGFGQQAIVIGGSIGGLLAARVLSERFARVTILERDHFPLPGEQRKGVPQGRHTHGLLASGRQALEVLYPTLVPEMATAGHLATVTGDARYHVGGGNLAPAPGRPLGLPVSRPRLEADVRDHTLAYPNIEVVEGCDVLGFVTSPGRSRITGVRVIRKQAGSAEEIIEGALVVDASGRGSRTPVWLEGLGYPRPEEDRVRIDMAYTSRFYRRRPDDLNGAAGVIVAATPENPRAAAMLAQEGDRWIVTLAGFSGERAPLDEPGFLAYARGLGTLDIYHIIRDAEPLSELTSYTFPANRRHRYERLDRFPEGLLVFADAICSFNPTYGQGMSVAAMEALALRRCLESGTHDLARRFFREAARIIDIPWSIVVSNDLRLPGVDGERTRQVRFINWYMSKLHVAARHDPELSYAFHEVTNLLAPPSTLMRPSIALRVLRGNLGQRDRVQPATSVAAPSATVG